MIGASDSREASIPEMISAVATLFPDLDYLSPSGTLALRGDGEPIDLVRLELPEKQYLGLQSIGLDGVPHLADIATVRPSSWWKWRERAFDARRLFDFDHPTGLMVQTDADASPWVEIRFSQPVPWTTLRLRNADDATAPRAAGIRISTGRDGSVTTRYDQGERLQQLHAVLSSSDDSSGDSSDNSPDNSPDNSSETASLLPVVERTVGGRYREAFDIFKRLALADSTRHGFRTAMNEHLLSRRNLEWTGHGPRRSFRFWSAEEKRDYLLFTSAVAREIAELTPDVCFGFGAVLGVIRDGGLIPHDDDLDLIVGLEASDTPGLQDGLRRVRDFLEPRGLTVAGNFSAHRHVSRGGGRSIDVFVGLFEGSTVSWYPSPRHLLRRSDVFPPSTGLLDGVEVPLPRNPLIYLDRVYGSDWRNPDPDHKHTWNPREYADLLPPGWGA